MRKYENDPSFKTITIASFSAFLITLVFMLVLKKCGEFVAFSTILLIVHGIVLLEQWLYERILRKGVILEKMSSGKFFGIVRVSMGEEGEKTLYIKNDPFNSMQVGEEVNFYIKTHLVDERRQSLFEPA